MIKGIFFDVGGTLYSYRNVQATMKLVLEKLAARLELEHDITEVARQYQLANKEVDRVFAEKPFFLFRNHLEATFASFLKRIDKQHLHGHFGWYEECYREMMIGCMQPMPDCHETLAKLKNKGLYLSAVSNADENHLAPLVERAQLHRWLTHWTSSEEAQSCKPDRRFFEIALKKSGLSAAHVLFVGDSLEHDIQGAHAMGMATVLISETDQPAIFEIGRETPEPDFRITSLSELPKIIEILDGRGMTMY